MMNQMNCLNFEFPSMVRLLALLIALTATIPNAQGSTVTGRVVKVYDGDTITVLDSSYTQHKIRLDGIDAPEQDQDYGAKATQALDSKKSHNPAIYYVQLTEALTPFKEIFSHSNSQEEGQINSFLATSC
jgi:endonuclease YncB( thermonuclease family)